MNKKGRLEITLKSDLCAGSGYAYASVVDSDISYNENGIPFISGRRLKGCLKETAKLLCITEEEQGKLFGVSGAKEGTGFHLSNAYPKELKAVDTWLTNYKAGSDDTYMDYLSQQKIVDLYTMTRSQTKLNESGSAQSNSLRFTRVVSHYSPIDNSELCFEADIEYPEAYETMLDKLVQGTRNIGMNRNRGLGSVVIKRVANASGKNLTEQPSTTTIEKVSEASEDCIISFVVRNIQPLVMSSTSDSESLSYVNGQSVLGALAGAYLRSGRTVDETFSHCFLMGDACFSNLTLCKQVNGDYVPLYPAPRFVNKLKKSGHYANSYVYFEERERLDKELEQEKDWLPKDGNQFKKLTDKLLVFNTDNTLSIGEVKKEIIYHHSHLGKSKDGKEGLLYNLEAIAPNQLFAGNIRVKKEYSDLLCELLRTASLRFGKSKTAQYGSCEVLPESVKVETTATVNQYQAGTKLMLAFLSDTQLLTDDGCPVVTRKQLEEALREELDLPVEKATFQNDAAFLSTKEVVGYNTMWNLKKPSGIAISAGSSLVFTLKSDWTCRKAALGEHCHEGFGSFLLYPVENMSYKLSENAGKAASGECDVETVKHLLKSLLISGYRKALTKKANAITQESKLAITPTALGRVTLMLKECVASGSKVEDFIERVNSIKSTGTRSEITNFLNNYLFARMEKIRFSNLRDDIDPSSKCSLTNVGAPDIKEYALLCQLVSEEEAERIGKSMWADYLMDIFVGLKYKKEAK